MMIFKNHFIKHNYKNVIAEVKHSAYEVLYINADLTKIPRYANTLTLNGSLTTVHVYGSIASLVTGVGIVEQ